MRDREPRLRDEPPDECPTIVSMVSTRLWMKKTWPPRRAQLDGGFDDRLGELHDLRLDGEAVTRRGVSMTDISRNPITTCWLRGIGVAESVNTSTRFFNCLRLSWGDAETLFFIHDDQTEITKAQVF